MMLFVLLFFRMEPASMLQFGEDAPANRRETAWVLVFGLGDGHPCICLATPKPHI